MPVSEITEALSATDSQVANAKNDIEPFSYLSDPWKPAQCDEDFRIRLIILYSTSVAIEDSRVAMTGTSTLNCHIFWTTLKSAPSFKTLSYSWGKKPASRKILVDEKYTLNITESLYTALEHCQDRNEPIILWIDQICINQNDDMEKSEQVANMGRIYRAAEEVLVWLGLADDSTENLFNVWKKVGKEAEDWGMMSYFTKERLPLIRNILNRVDPTDPKTVEFNQICNRALKLYDQAFVDAMISWEACDWFSRVWVVQEFSLARTATFVCGSERINADHVLLARHVFQNAVTRAKKEEPGLVQLKNCEVVSSDTLYPFFATRQRRKGRDAGYGTEESLYRLLQTLHVSKKMQATEDCDKIYAVLGLATDVDKLKVCADYRLKSRIEFIYTQTAKAIIANGNLDMIHLAQGPRDQIKVPSWVPNWSGSLQRSFAWEPDKENITLFDVSKESKPELLDVAEAHVLGLGGTRVDEIQTVYGLWNGDDIETEDPQLYKPHVYTGYRRYLELISSVCSHAAAKQPAIYSDTKRRNEAIWRIPIGDIEVTTGLARIRATSSSLRAYQEFLMQLDAFELSRPMTKEESDRVRERTSYTSYYKIRMRQMRNKRPFVSKTGYVGMGPAEMRRGDWVVVFLGARLPYVIRPYDANYWLLVGECYCDGIMDGEAVGNGKKESFYLI